MGELMLDEIVIVSHVEQAKRGDLKFLGESLCIVCDDMGIDLNEVVEECGFTRLTHELAKAALDYGRSNRRDT